MGNNSFMFDWARSNMGVVCDAIENGLEWHINNNILNKKIYPEYHTDKLEYYHIDRMAGPNATFDIEYL